MIVMTAVVAEWTADWERSDYHRVLTAAGWLMICVTALLVGGLTFAFSESRFPRRGVYAAIGIAIGFGLALWRRRRDARPLLDAQRGLSKN